MSVDTNAMRYAMRRLLRNPTFSIFALLTLAIGIGANAAVFSVVNGVLLKPLPYPRSEELVDIMTGAPGAPTPGGQGLGINDLPESASMYFTYAEQNRTFAKLGLWMPTTSAVTGIGEPEQVPSVVLTPDALEALAVQPALGRWLAQGDGAAQGPQTVMLGYGYWQRRFGADRSVLGRTINIGAQPWEIVGVMPKDFRIVNAEADLILPFRLDRSQLFLTPFSFQMIARLKPGVSLPEASADLARLSPVWLRSWPMFGGSGQFFESWKIRPAARPLKEQVVGNVGNVLWVLMGTIGIVMLIACANVANLLLVRAEARQQDLAVRAALGAGSWRIVRELLLESLLLGLLGGVLGLVLAFAGLRFLVALGPANLPRLHEVSMDLRALGFTFTVSIVSGLLFGLIPALKYGGLEISRALHSSGRAMSGSRERHRARNSLVVVQVALALVLLISSGLMLRTFEAMRAVQPGFTEPAQLQTIRVPTPPFLVSEAQRVIRVQNDVLDKLAAIPGVSAAGFSSSAPMDGIPVARASMGVEGDSDAQIAARPLQFTKYVSPGYFQTAGTRLIAGRDYTWTDVYNLRQVGIVSENLARRIWGSPSAALGKRIRAAPNRPWREIIGVVQDVLENGADKPAPSMVYWPPFNDLYVERPDATRQVTFFIRSGQAGTEGFLKQVREAVWSVNPNFAVASMQTMQQISSQSMSRTSFTLVMLGIAGAMALLLGIVGIYGVISYAVMQRRREIGIRLALGAQQRQLRRMFLRHALLLAGIGVAIGLGVAVGLMRFMRSLLFEVSPVDPVTYVAVPFLLVAVAALASYIPARAASSVDPVHALKLE
jgi:predicted permease